MTQANIFLLVCLRTFDHGELGCKLQHAAQQCAVIARVEVCGSAGCVQPGARNIGIFPNTI